jgi:hypothetical protein
VDTFESNVVFARHGLWTADGTTTTCFLCRLDKRIVSKENYPGSGMRTDFRKPRGQPSRRWSTQAYDDEEVAQDVLRNALFERRTTLFSQGSDSFS